MVHILTLPRWGKVGKQSNITQNHTNSAHAAQELGRVVMSIVNSKLIVADICLPGGVDGNRSATKKKIANRLIPFTGI